MARKNTRERSTARPSSGGRKQAASGGRKKTANSAPAGAARKRAARSAGASGRKSAGGKKTAAAKSTGRARKPAARKGGAAKAEAREMTSTRASKRAPAKRRRSATTRRATARGRSAGARRSPSRNLSRYSQSAQRGLWIASPDQHAERPGQTLVTRDHDVIMKWAEERGAEPATIAGTEHDGRPGVLRFDFPNFGSGGRLRPVDWDEWFETFDQRHLVFVFQEEMKSGRQSNFFRLDSPDREEG